MGLLDLICRSQEFKNALEQARPRLYRVAYAWCHNPALADDLVQDTLIKAWRKAGQLRDQQSRDAWLFSIMANCYRDHFRRHRDMEDIDDFELPFESSPESEHIQHETVHKVRSAIARLPEGQRQVITLVDLEGLSYVEVAHVLQIPSGTVMSRLSRARSRLRELLLNDLEPGNSATASLRRIK